MSTVNYAVSPPGVATIELNRPNHRNACDPQLLEELAAAIGRAREDEAVRAVMLTGAGGSFSSGADLRDGGAGELTPEGRPDVYKVLTQHYNPLIGSIRALEKPVVAAVEGPAAGVGCSIALACDLILAAQSSYFLLAFVNIGLVPDGGCSALLPTRAGAARAAEMAMLGERVAASEALQWGLINRVVADDRLRTEAMALAERLASGPTRSYAAIKRQLNSWLYRRLDDQMELEAQTQREVVSTDDFLEGVTAFIEKRPPRFTGH